MNFFRGLSAAFLVSFVGIACAQEAEDDSFARRDAFVSDFCEIVSGCCERTFGAIVTKDVCVQNTLVFDSAATEDDKARTDCIAQLQAAVAKHQGAFCAKYGRSEIPACPDIRRAENVGAAKPGEPCAKAGDCAPSFDGPVQCNNGGCQVLRRGKVDDLPCVATDEGGVEKAVGGIVPGPNAFVCFVSEDNVYCDATTRKCTTPKPVGSTCEKHEECVRTAYCNETSKKCQVRKPTDQSCNESAECQERYYCEKEVGFCRDDAKEGEVCDVNEQCITGSCSAGKCAPATSKDPRLEPVCKAAPPPGGG